MRVLSVPTHVMYKSKGSLNYTLEPYKAYSIRHDSWEELICTGHACLYLINAKTRQEHLIVAPQSNRTCPHLAGVGRWIYCDENAQPVINPFRYADTYSNQ